MDLVKNAVVPVVRTRENHGARRATQCTGCIASFEQHARCCQPVQVRCAARRAVRDARPLLLIRHDVENVGPVCRGGRGLARSGSEGRGPGEEMTAIDTGLIFAGLHG